MENRTARLTLLIDPKKKAVFEQLCAREDMNASQMVRKFIRDYIEQQLGPDWRERILGDEGTSAERAEAIRQALRERSG